MSTRSFIVQSRRNQRVKALRAALRQGISGAGEVGLEGPHLIEEAMRSRMEMVTVFVRQGSPPPNDLSEETEVVTLPQDIFASAVTTESPQGVAALVRAPQWTIKDVLRQAVPLVLVAAGLQDPGNLGTLIRSAEAFGAGGVLTLPGTVSPWNAKCVRASSGSVFRLPVVAVEEADLFETLRRHQIQALAAAANGQSSAVLRRPTAILIGNEGAGISPELIARCDGAVGIPYSGLVESLNAAVAGSILLYEASRQRAGV